MHRPLRTVTQFLCAIIALLVVVQYAVIPAKIVALATSCPSPRSATRRYAAAIVTRRVPTDMLAQVCLLLA